MLHRSWTSLHWARDVAPPIDMFKLVHYEVWTVGKSRVDIEMLSC